MPRRYAEGTTVPVSRTKVEIANLLEAHGAKKYGVMSDADQGLTVLMCELEGRMLRFEVYAVDSAQFEQTASGRSRTPEAIKKACATEEKRRWRAQLLILKAKLEAIAGGDATVDSEFLAHIMLPNGGTVGQAMGPKLDAAYRTGEMPTLPLLPGA